MSVLKAPFPYYGGKSTIATSVWQALGQPKHYMEPFFGSGAVLLSRPDYQIGTHIESVCDKDGFLSNVWRSLQADPDEVAKWCDFPVNHADLAARRKRLIENEEYLLQNLITDDNWYDAKLAGYWIWAASCWIGSGLTRLGKRPHLSGGGMGVHALGQIPHLADGGRGIHALVQIPDGSDDGKAVQEPYNTNTYRWFRQLSERLRYVRVVCGDWTRVCGGDWQDKIGSCGIFFDPPYGVETRHTDIYHHDSTSVAAAVREWCKERGNRPSYRIVLAGYFEEHEELLDCGWRVQRWTSQGGYGNLARLLESQGRQNRYREALFFSPHCIESQSKLL